MKLLLINPFDRTTCSYSTHFPPLSIGYIAALTPPDFHVEFMDENFHPFAPRKADLVAITAMTIQANRAYEICRIYKSMGIPVVLGGIHPTVMPEEAMKYASSVVMGEAEALWPVVIEDFRNNRLKPFYRSGAYPTLQNQVFPRRELFSPKYLFDCIQTSRGCPFHCDFCSVPVLNGRVFRLRPVEEVLDELETIKKKFVFFVDDNIVGFGLRSEERAVALFEGMLRRGIKKHWISQASLNVAGNEVLLRLMRRTGCLGLLIGFESLDRKTLQHFGKSHNLSGSQVPERFYKEVINKMHRNGIAVNGYFCYGYEDDIRSIRKSTSFILRSGVDIVNNPIVIPSPGTPFYDKLGEKIEFRNYPADWNKYLGRLVYTPKGMTKKGFYKAYLHSSEKIFSLPESIRRGLRSLRWSKNLFQSLMIFLFNLGYRRMRQTHLSIMLRQDPDLRSAYDEMKRLDA